MRSSEFAQKSRRSSDAPLRIHQKAVLARVRRRESDLLNRGEFGKDRAGLRRWTEIPYVLLVQGGVSTAPDERIHPAKCDPLDDGNVVFGRILDGLDTATQISDT